MSIKKVALGDVIEFRNGKALKSEDIGEYTVFGSNGPIGKTAAANNQDAIIVGRVGAYCGSVEVCEEKFWASDNTIVARPLDSQDLYYWYYRLKSFPLRSYAGGAAQPLLTQNTLCPLQIDAHTDLSEQIKISRILKKYDDLIENNRRRIQLLEECARLLYKEWFVQLRFPGHEHVKVIDGVPEGWELGLISDYFNTTSGGTPSRSRPEFYEGDINWVKTQELDERFIFDTDEKITEEAVKSSSAKIFPANSLLVSIYGGTNIGRTGIIDKPSATNQACVVLLPKRCTEDYMYIQQWLKHNRSYLIGLSQGAAQTNISQQTLKSLEILWPRADLINLFIEEVRPMYMQIRNLGLQIGQLEKARDILLPRLMNGELAA